LGLTNPYEGSRFFVDQRVSFLSKALLNYIVAKREQERAISNTILQIVVHIVAE